MGYYGLLIKINYGDEETKETTTKLSIINSLLSLLSLLSS